MSEESCRQPETSPDAAQSNTTILSGDRNEQLKQLLELKWKHAHPRACSSVLLDYRSQDSLDLLPQRGFECELGPESESEPEQDLESESEPEQDLESEPELEPELTFLEKTWQLRLSMDRHLKSYLLVTGARLWHHLSTLCP